MADESLLQWARIAAVDSLWTPMPAKRMSGPFARCHDSYACGIGFRVAYSVK